MGVTSYLILLLHPKEAGDRLLSFDGRQQSPPALLPLFGLWLALLGAALPLAASRLLSTAHHRCPQGDCWHWQRLGLAAHPLLCLLPGWAVHWLDIFFWECVSSFLGWARGPGFCWVHNGFAVWRRGAWKWARGSVTFSGSGHHPPTPNSCSHTQWTRTERSEQHQLRSHNQGRQS